MGRFPFDHFLTKLALKEKHVSSILLYSMLKFYATQHILPTEILSKQVASISLYSINCLVSITKTECAYCVVRTEYLNTDQGYYSL
jgi:hypothetical protein